LVNEVVENGIKKISIITINEKG